MTDSTMTGGFPGKRITVNGIRLNVIDVGEGEPVLLVHGFPDTHAVWRQQIPALVQAGYRVIAPDTRGCGESDLPPATADYKLPKLVADLAALLDALKIQKVKLVGHDWGAVIAWQFAIAHPQRVTRYVALSVGHPTAYARGGLMQKLKGWYVLFFQLRGLAEIVLKALDWWMFRAITGYPAEFPHWRAALSRPGRLTAGIRYYRANLSLVWPRRFAPVAVPVTGVWSDGDRFLTESQMRDSAQYCAAGFDYVRVDNANHWLQLDAPERTTAVILQALAQGEGA
jgi:pimeloyl-ACP methyl ester carboxylesterase